MKVFISLLKTQTISTTITLHIATQSVTSTLTLTQANLMAQKQSHWMKMATFTYPSTLNYLITSTPFLSFLAFFSVSSFVYTEVDSTNTGTAEGNIIRVSAKDESLEVYARVGGRPLGLAFDADKNLIICDSLKGIYLPSPLDTSLLDISPFPSLLFPLLTKRIH